MFSKLSFLRTELGKEADRKALGTAALGGFVTARYLVVPFGGQSGTSLTRLRNLDSIFEMLNVG
jgi:hypothetical protein